LPHGWRSIPSLSFALQTVQNHGLQLFCPVSSSPLASAKTCYAPAAAQAIIVLPAFARSLPADGREGRNKIVKAKSVRVKKQELRKRTIKYKAVITSKTKVR
jgi:hypothetical protein